MKKNAFQNELNLDFIDSKYNSIYIEFLWFQVFRRRYCTNIPPLKIPNFPGGFQYDYPIDSILVIECIC